MLATEKVNKTITKNSVYGTSKITLIPYEERLRESFEKRQRINKNNNKENDFEILPSLDDRRAIAATTETSIAKAVKSNKTISRIENDILVQYRQDGTRVSHEVKGLIFKKVKVSDTFTTYISCTVPWIEHEDIRRNIELMISYYDQDKLDAVPPELHTRYLLRKGSFGMWSYRPAYSILKFMDQLRSGNYVSDYLMDEVLVWNSTALNKLREVAEGIHQ